MKQPIRTIEADLTDATEQGGPVAKVTIKVFSDMIIIAPEGHGVCPMDDDFDEVMLIENTNGQPRVFIWGDINQEDPTHIINLKGARLEKRTETPSGSSVTYRYEDDES